MYVTLGFLFPFFSTRVLMPPCSTLFSTFVFLFFSQKSLATGCKNIGLRKVLTPSIVEDAHNPRCVFGGSFCQCVSIPHADQHRRRLQDEDPRDTRPSPLLFRQTATVGAQRQRSEWPYQRYEGFGPASNDAAGTRGLKRVCGKGRYGANCQFLERRGGHQWQLRGKAALS